jgi:hypothetical protein
LAAASFCPSNQREEAVSHLPQPASLLLYGKVQIGLGPTFRPMIFVAVEFRSTKPILQSKLTVVADAQTALLRAVDEKKTTERPKCLSAQMMTGLLVEHKHPLPRIGPRQSCNFVTRSGIVKRTVQLPASSAQGI